jgi:hypothetical protein
MLTRSNLGVDAQNCIEVVAGYLPDYSSLASKSG